MDLGGHFEHRLEPYAFFANVALLTLIFRFATLGFATFRNTADCSDVIFCEPIFIGINDNLIWVNVER